MGQKEKEKNEEKGAHYCVEASWEVCNKVGGIYTVLSSKAASMKEYYGEKYFSVGPYFANKVRGEFNEKIPPEPMGEVFERLKSEGIVCHYGNWLIKAEPEAVLIDFANFTAKKNEIKRELWNNYEIDSLNTEYFDYDEPVIWAYAAGKLVEAFAASQPGSRVVAHFHEWLAAAGLLYLKSRKAKVATVFTTHATTLGRTMTSADIDIYTNIGRIDAEQEAYRLGAHTKHQTEVAAAANADVFSTVSDITALEAEHFLKKKPDIILHNGLNMGNFPTFEEASVRHRQLKRKINAFTSYYFFPYYIFDIEETLYYFLSARYEFHNKGIDVFIRALGELNLRLKQEKSRMTVVAFIWAPANTRGIKTELLENRTRYMDVKDSISDEIEVVKDKLITSALAQNKVCDADLLTSFNEVKRKVLRFRKSGNPPLCTHDLYSEENDLILGACADAGLNNLAEDRVKVVFYPVYLTGADGLLELGYYESMQGSHLGVFPSFYEPWGYTPLEAAALGVCAVTTDLSGFGKYIEGHSAHAQKRFPGVFVIKRMGVSDDDLVKSLSNLLITFASYSQDERIKNKIEAKHVSTLADWRFMVKQYITAHQIAIGKHWK